LCSDPRSNRKAYKGYNESDRKENALRYFLGEGLKEALDEEIKGVMEEMSKIGVYSPEYGKMMGYLERLNTVKKDVKRPPLSKETIALILGNLAGVILILIFEQNHVLTSKGFNRLIQPR
jgi:hypothetical protein